MIEVLENIENYSDSALRAYSVFQENYRRMNNQLLTYENAIDGLYEVGTIYAPIETESFNPYSILVDWVRIEILDLKAIMECIQRKEEFVTMKSRFEANVKKSEGKIEAIKAGKKSLGSRFSGKTPEEKVEELEQSIILINRDIEMVEFISQVIVARLANHEIPKFKERKGETYTNIMKTFAEKATGEYQEVVNACKKTVQNIN